MSMNSLVEAYCASEASSTLIIQMLSRILKISLLMSFLSIHPCSSNELGDLRSGVSAYQAGNYTRALADLKPLAGRVDVEAMFYMGQMAHTGKGIPRNEEDAIKWYRLSAEKGYAPAQYWFGQLRKLVDVDEGLSWIRRAADSGYKDAFWSMGNHFEQRGSNEDLRIAAHWYSRGMATGCVDCMVAAGLLYTDGRGVGRNPERAAAIFRDAANAGSVSGATFLGALYLDGDGVPRNYAEALRWLRPAAEKDFKRAQHFMGFIYANGLGVKRSYQQAVYWTALASAAGYEDSLKNLTLFRGQLQKFAMTGESIRIFQNPDPKSNVIGETSGKPIYLLAKYESGWSLVYAEENNQLGYVKLGR